MDPSNTPLRLLVVGSDDFPYRRTVGEALLHWWLNHDRPHTELVVDNTVIGLEAGKIWNLQRYPIHQHPAPMEDPVHEAYRRQVMLLNVTEALIFDTTTSPSDWLFDLAAEGTAWSRVRVDRG